MIQRCWLIPEDVDEDDRLKHKPVNHSVHRVLGTVTHLDNIYRENLECTTNNMSALIKGQEREIYTHRQGRTWNISI